MTRSSMTFTFTISVLCTLFAFAPQLSICDDASVTFTSAPLSTADDSGITNVSQTTVTTSTTSTTTTTLPPIDDLPSEQAAESEHRSSLTLFFILIVLGCCILVVHILITTKFIYVPESVAVIIVGGVVGLILAFLAKHKIANWKQEEMFPPNIFFIVLLPPIIFESGYNLSKGNFFQNIGSALVFAIFGTAISALIIGSGIYLLGVASIAYKFSIVESFAFGSLVSAVDPVATLAIFQALDADPILYMLVFGESILNDAVAIVLTQTVLELASPAMAGVSGLDAIIRSVWRFGLIFIGSAVIGVITAAISALMLKMLNLRNTPSLELGMMIIFVYLPYTLAEGMHFSGSTFSAPLGFSIMSILFGAIVMSHYTHRNLSLIAQLSIQQMFRTIAFMAETCVFAYLGMAIFSVEHVFKLSLVIWAIALCLIARAANIFPLSAVLNRYRTHKITRKMQVVMWFTGLRGAIAFALVMNLASFEEETRRVLITTTLIIVLFTIIVHGGTTLPLMRLLNIEKQKKKTLTLSKTQQGMADAVDSQSELNFTTDDEAISFVSEARRGFMRLDFEYIMPFLTKKYTVEEMRAGENQLVDLTRQWTTHWRLQSFSLGGFSRLETPIEELEEEEEDDPDDDGYRRSPHHKKALQRSGGGGGGGPTQRGSSVLGSLVAAASHAKDIGRSRQASGVPESCALLEGEDDPDTELHTSTALRGADEGKFSTVDLTDDGGDESARGTRTGGGVRLKERATGLLRSVLHSFSKDDTKHDRHRADSWGAAEGWSEVESDDAFLSNPNYAVSASANRRTLPDGRTVDAHRPMSHTSLLTETEKRNGGVGYGTHGPSESSCNDKLPAVTDQQQRQCDHLQVEDDNDLQAHSLIERVSSATLHSASTESRSDLTPNPGSTETTTVELNHSRPVSVIDFSPGDVAQASSSHLQVSSLARDVFTFSAGPHSLLTASTPSNLAYPPPAHSSSSQQLAPGSGLISPNSRGGGRDGDVFHTPEALLPETRSQPDLNRFANHIQFSSPSDNDNDPSSNSFNR